jgi:hypothetical protein
MVIAEERKENSVYGNFTHREHAYEVMAFCPGCMEIQTLVISRKHLVKTSKYFQQNNAIYHDCSSAIPCRLFRC